MPSSQRLGPTAVMASYFPVVKCDSFAVLQIYTEYLFLIISYQYAVYEYPAIPHYCTALMYASFCCAVCGLLLLHIMVKCVSDHSRIKVPLPVHVNQGGLQRTHH